MTQELLARKYRMLDLAKVLQGELANLAIEARKEFESGPKEWKESQLGQTAESDAFMLKEAADETAHVIECLKRR